MSLILAIDLGKFNSVLCGYEPDTKATAFRTIKTAPAELRKELLRQPVAQVVIEACSQAGWVHDLSEELKLPRARRQHHRGRVAVEARQTEDRSRRRAQARPARGGRRDRKRAGAAAVSG